MWQLTTTSNLWKGNNLLQKYFTVPFKKDDTQFRENLLKKLLAQNGKFDILRRYYTKMVAL